MIYTVMERPVPPDLVGVAQLQDSSCWFIVNVIKTLPPAGSKTLPPAGSKILVYYRLMPSVYSPLLAKIKPNRSQLNLSRLRFSYLNSRYQNMSE
jgi:hypothetical protein